MIFHIVQEVTPETVLGRTQQDWAGDIEGVEGRPHQAVSLRIHSSIVNKLNYRILSYFTRNNWTRAWSRDLIKHSAAPRALLVSRPRPRPIISPKVLATVV